MKIIILLMLLCTSCATISTTLDSFCSKEKGRDTNYNACVDQELRSQVVVNNTKQYPKNYKVDLY
jgi:hypothetical protein